LPPSQALVYVTWQDAVCALAVPAVKAQAPITRAAHARRCLEVLMNLSLNF
jgi:hypothetical protein